ncbi:MAG: hypothetical protein R2706_18750 [Acidimicrobiales bacterium]
MSDAAVVTDEHRSDDHGADDHGAHSYEPRHFQHEVGVMWFAPRFGVPPLFGALS